MSPSDTTHNKSDGLKEIPEMTETERQTACGACGVMEQVRVSESESLIDRENVRVCVRERVRVSVCQCEGETPPLKSTSF